MFEEKSIRSNQGNMFANCDCSYFYICVFKSANSISTCYGMDKTDFIGVDEGCQTHFTL